MAFDVYDGAEGAVDAVGGLNLGGCSSRRSGEGEGDCVVCTLTDGGGEGDTLRLVGGERDCWGPRGVL